MAAGRRLLVPEGLCTPGVLQYRNRYASWSARPAGTATKDGDTVPLMARRPWLSVMLWIVLLGLAVPLLGQVTAHLSSGGFTAPHSLAAYADSTTAHLKQPPSVPTTIVSGLGQARVAQMAADAGVPSAWLHRLGSRAVVLVPLGRGMAVHQFLGSVRTAGGRLTAVTDQAIGHAVSRQAIHAFTSSTVVAVPALILLLLLVFGAAVPALLPLITAGVGSVLTLAVVAIAERYLPLSVYLLQIVSFLALGVGVDYALFVSSRFRTQLESGSLVDAALTDAMRTSGRSVLFSGLAVALALAALVLGGTPYWAGMALGGAVAVASVLLVTHTLLPALLRLIGRRISVGRVAFALPDWRLWRVLAHWATAQPGLALALGLAVLVIPAISAPAIQASMPANVAAMLPSSAPLARAQAIEQQVEGPGHIAPFVVALTLNAPVTSARAWALVAHVTTALRSLHGVANVVSPTGSVPPVALAVAAGRRGGPLSAFVSGAHRVDLFVVSAYGPDSARSARLLARMESRLHTIGGTRVAVGGQVAVVQGFNHYLDGRLPAMALAVVLVAFVVLLLATGSVLQALLGVALNGLVSLATAGILVSIIERGAFGVRPEPLNLAVVPLVFVLLFGLSMDYEVILLHRVQERLHHGDSPQHAARHAVGTTGGMITGAGLVMVAVVAALLVSPFELLQTLAIGLVSAVLLDTLVVRTFVVPAVITLAGHYAFWPRVSRPAPETLN
jgi:uncharacterized membrane protein YdfJ with MMPL/SSD domain